MFHYPKILHSTNSQCFYYYRGAYIAVVYLAGSQNPGKSRSTPTHMVFAPLKTKKYVEFTIIKNERM